MSYLTSIINVINRRRLKEIDYFRKHPAEVQERILKHLIRRAAGTKWGKDHQYSSINTFSEFKERVPLQTYEDIIPFVERIRSGEKDLLWPGEVRWFAKSSGTTGARSKFIPVTWESLEDCHYRGGRDVIALYLHMRPKSSIFRGKGLILGGSHRIDNFSNKSLYGDLSAILIENTPYWFNFVRTPSKKIALIEDFEKKLEMIVKLTVNQNVTSLSGVPSWFLVLIRQILESTGRKNLREVWPGLEVFFHGGVSFSPYREHFRQLIGNGDFCYMETYNASEGFFGIQDDLSSPGMLMMLDKGIFYEFIPATEAGNRSAVTLGIGEVSQGVNYAMVISTNGGLWRYIIGDTIMFTSLYPHKFIITGRTKHFLNVFGEEVIVENADRAIEAACNATGAVVNEYTAGPVFSGTETRGSHEWLIEFQKKPADMELFTVKLDEALKEVNSDYEAKRYKDLNLVMPVVRAVPEGTFYRWLKEKNKLGGQNKVPRLSNSREYIEDLYKTAGIQ
ncbi:MAG: GH3 auxin-responsive promoter family protein [Bacteroidales bacterium]|nr:GH3 auxin-responsive promoter family protein [Bacteroidales bacterium]